MRRHEAFPSHRPVTGPIFNPCVRPLGPGAGATTLREIADAMEARGIRTPSGLARWHPATVLYVLRAMETHTAKLPLAA
jgi:hypothetical protein